MEVIFDCPACGREIEGDAELGGGTAQCPGCGETILVPAGGIEPGTMLAGYRIEGLLGTGGMGEVFLATQVAMDRKVALKVLPPAMTKSQDSVDRFLHEVRMAAKLEHPNVVTAFDAGQDGGYYYLAMSFVEGEDLYDRLEREGVLPERDVMIIALDVAEALSYAWRKHKILHRDVKPANVMIDVAGDVRLMDMGIAKSIAEDSSLTMAGMYVGTPFYMSPEQCRAESDLDCRSDIYSLGATMYHLLTGEKPFFAPASMAVLAAHLTEPLASPRRKRPELSIACDYVMSRMMAKDRDKRYRDWPEVIADLRAILAVPEPTELRLPPLPDPLPVGGKGASDATPPTIVAQMATGSGAAVTAPPPPPSADPAADSVPGLMPAVEIAAEAPLPASPSMTAPDKNPADSVNDEDAAIRYRADSKAWSRAMAIVVVLAALFFVVAGSIFAWNSVSRNQADQVREDRNQSAEAERETVAAVEGAIAYQQTRAELAARVEEQDRQIREMLAKAAEFEKVNPDNPTAALAQYAAIESFAKGTAHAVVVAQHLQRLKDAATLAPDKILARLAGQAETAAADWRFHAAAEVFRGYDGPLAVETAAQRAVAAEDYLRRQTALDAALAKTRDGLLAAARLDVAGMQQGVVSIEQTPGWQKDSYLQSASDRLRDLLGTLRRVADSFEADMGREVALNVDGRDGNWRIRGVSGFSIRADFGGRTETLTPARLSAKLLLQRAETGGEVDGYRMLKAVLAAQANRFDVTQRELGELPDAFFVRALSGVCLLGRLSRESWQPVAPGTRLELQPERVAIHLGGAAHAGMPQAFGNELTILDARGVPIGRWQMTWRRDDDTLILTAANGNSGTFRTK